MDSLTQQTLEFDKVKSYLAQLTCSALGTTYIDSLTSITDPSKIDIWLSEVSELKEIRALYGHLPVEGIHDIQKSLSHARIEGAILPPIELRHIYETLRAGRATKKFIADIEPPIYPNIQEKVEGISFLDAVESAIRQAIDEEGEILDGASQKLKRIRKELRQVREKIQTWLQNFLQRQDYQSIIQDQVITRRRDRYVIPIKASSRGKIKGIVHDQSASGVTVFIEPLETVELNNRIALLEAEEKEEIRKILLELTDLIREHLPPIQESVSILGELDFINAKARLSEKWKCSQPKLSQDRCISLLRARHPLLLVQHEYGPEHVVPIDVHVDESYTTVLITGPNTGGKTVSLKTIGLLALMVQAGMHIPVDPDSEISVFENIYADIGDQQSIEQNLSTFSSHISHIVDILKNANNRSLILLDELGAGTDPAEGASLGIAILEYLDQLEATCIATTHHDALKSYAYTHPRTMNACVEFDVNTLSPTYRLLFGLPGKSNAYIIAERLGLPRHIIQRAKELMGEDLHKVHYLIQKLTTDSEEIEKKKAEIDARMRGVSRLEKETDRLLALAEQERQDMLNKALEEAKLIVDQALHRSQEVLAKLPALTREEGKKLLKILHKEATTVKQRIAQTKKVDETPPLFSPSELIKGQQVQLAGIGQTGTLLDISKDGKQAELQVGAMRIEMPINQLTPIYSAHVGSRPQKISVSESPTSLDESDFVTTEFVIVGKQVDEALDEVDKYLDRAFLLGLSSVTIIHGIGTGRLKNAVLSLLRSHPHVLNYSTAEHNQGATVVGLKQR
jgi:DNA mismatch repair protein MutS2